MEEATAWLDQIEKDLMAFLKSSNYESAEETLYSFWQNRQNVLGTHFPDLFNYTPGKEVSVPEECLFAMQNSIESFQGDAENWEIVQACAAFFLFKNLITPKNLRNSNAF